MKKARLFSIFTLIVILTLAIFVGCEKKDEISSIYLKDHDAESVIEMAVGEFDFSAYTLVVSYESGASKELTLTSDMIVDADQFKFYQEGEHEITVSYQKKTYVFKIHVKRSEFGDLRLPSDTVYTYNGEPHVIEVEGDLPANAVVTYPFGNSFTNAGIYDVTAIVSCEGYVTVKLSTTVKIERAVHDMSGVKFEAKEIVYDGQSHSVEITGTLPEGVPEPKYYINESLTSSAIDVGEYMVLAIFDNTDPNYEPIPYMQTTLTISPATYSLKDIDIVFKNEDGTAIDGLFKPFDGLGVTFDVSNYASIADKVSVSFSVYDEEGRVISISNKSTGILNVGVYTVKAEFLLADSKNYKPIAPMERVFEVQKADYVLGGVYFESKRFTYDGEEHALEITGTLPEGLSVSYEYYLDGELITDSEGKPVQTVTEAGRYTVNAIITHTDINYNDIEVLSAVLDVEKAAIDISSIGFVEENTYEYDGKMHGLQLATNLPDFVSVEFQYYRDGVLIKDSDGNAVKGVTDPGIYSVVATFTVSDPNYTSEGIMSGTLVINKANIVIDRNQMTEKSFTYDGQAHLPELNDIPDSVTVTKTIYLLDDQGIRTPVESAVDCGDYVVSYAFTVKDSVHYELAVSEIDWSFSIAPQKVNVRFENTEFIYNGENQYPTVPGLPDCVTVDMKLYTENGTEPINESVNAGKYRCVVMLYTSNTNYELSATKLEVNFEIKPQTIEISGLSFGSTELTYVRASQHPELIGVPEHVNLRVSLYQKDRTPVDEAKYVGEYICTIVLEPENANYKLSGQLGYETEFVISKRRIDVAELGFGTINNPIIYDYNNVSGAVQYKHYGDLDYDLYRKFIFCVYDNSRLYYHDGVSFTTDGSSYDAELRNRYFITLTLRVEDPSNVVFVLNGEEYSTVEVQHYFNIE